MVPGLALPPHQSRVNTCTRVTVDRGWLLGKLLHSPGVSDQHSLVPPTSLLARLLFPPSRDTREAL